MQNYGRSTVSEFLGENLVYRNLAPMDTRLPSLVSMRQELGIAANYTPRKSELAYASVVAHLIREARMLDAATIDIQRLVFVGDTRMNDGTAFENLCQVSDWPGLGFIGSETEEPVQTEVIQTTGGRQLYLANRWNALKDFDQYCAKQDFYIDEKCAVVIDLDKTALGARGRNSHVIDHARVQAVERTVAGLLGQAFDPSRFRKAYGFLKMPEFHTFTADNQDYLAYICLILGSGIEELNRVLTEVRSGELKTFSQFIGDVQMKRAELSKDLRSIHDEIYTAVQAGDPTPFKAFRRNEYLETVGRMGFLVNDAPLETLLAEEIVITQEVRAQALEWAHRGALLFGLSDKPDEASIPTTEQLEMDYQPIHRTETHVVGS